MNSTVIPAQSSKLEFCVPSSELGSDVHSLISQCPPLDTNSLYCNLLQCSHFADTSVAVFSDSALVGFVSGYLIPSRDEDTLFVWQVAVSEKARGQKLASRMIEHILKRPACRQVRFLETTITPGNEASWALFSRVARSLDAGLEDSVIFDKEKHFKGQHDSEVLVRIGPFSV